MELKDLYTVGKAVGGAAGGAVIGPALALTTWVKGKVDAYSDKLLEKERGLEGCPHVRDIRGWSTPTPDMVAHVAAHGGVAWKTNDGNSYYYWHEQNDFSPLHAREVWIRAANAVTRAKLPMKRRYCRIGGCRREP